MIPVVKRPTILMKRTILCTLLATTSPMFAAETKTRPVRFSVITGRNYYDRDLHAEGWKIYDPMRALNPDFFVHTGDILYYDSCAKSLPLARWMWQQVYGIPRPNTHGRAKSKCP